MCIWKRDSVNIFGFNASVCCLVTLLLIYCCSYSVRFDIENLDRIHDINDALNCDKVLKIFIFSFVKDIYL